MANDISSIQIKYSIEVNTYQMQLHNDDWNSKVYAPRTPCSQPMGTLMGSCMAGGIMQ